MLCNPEWNHRPIDLDPPSVADPYVTGTAALFAYVSNRIPEIADDLFKIDQAMRAGFGWEIGPFEYWDAVGLERGLKAMDASDKPAAWIAEMQKGSDKKTAIRESLRINLT